MKVAEVGESEAGVAGISELARRVGRDLERAAATVGRWRKEAREADRFMAGQQWHPADEARLNEEDRPTAVFNYAQKYIRIVAGTEQHNRQEVVFVPRMPQAGLANAAGELASAIYSSVIEACNGPEERSAAFEDMLVRGMGWTGIRLEMELDPEGRIVMERVDGLKMYWDPAARKQNLEDARWVACEEEIALQEAIRRWPYKESELRAAQFLSERPGQGELEVEHATPIEYQPGNQTELALGPPAGSVRVVEYQYYEVQPRYRLADPLSGELIELGEDEFKRLARRLAALGERMIEGGEGRGVGYVRQERRVYKRVFCAGPLELAAGDLPVQGVGFTYKALTGGFDAAAGVWRGLLHVLMDPQRFANKFFSQTLHIINSNAKGGLLAEATAFADPTRAEQDWANPAALILLEDGALSGNHPRIQERSRPALPEGTFVMLKWCIEALGGVSGINPELLGATVGDVPGVAQRQRQVQGMTINAGYFSALTRYLREEARTVFEFIRNFVADGRLVNLGGPYNSRAIPLLREHLPVDYSLVIDEPTKSPNAKEAFWDKMAPIIPVLIKNNAFLPEILDYSPFPASIVARLKAQLEQRAGASAAGGPLAAAGGGQGSSAQLAATRARVMEQNLALREQESRLRQLGSIVATAGKLMDTQARARRQELEQGALVADLLARHGARRAR
ncbi:MAG TPA: hypothetical protein VKV28_04880 [Candidatus Binataceae bacterium]|nr:hypothetical protein [Candidatus Binataceae bacterium]